MGARALSAARGPRPPGTLAVIALLVAYLAAAWGFALPMPFISDDWQILARVRTASFGALWGGQDLLWRWWRPWSRELHFWSLSRLFGPREPAFHAVSFALWVAVLALFFTLARRAAGPRVAAIACAGLAALSAWSGALLWAAGVQDLWMLVWVLLYLHAVARGRAWLALVALAGALLSKELAAVAPGLGFAWALWVSRARAATALRRIAPHAALVTVWVVVHPTLRDRLLHPAQLDVELPRRTESLVTTAMRTLGTLINLQYAPHPQAGWAAAIVPALPAIAVVVALGAWAAFARGAAGGGATGGGNEATSGGAAPARARRARRSAQADAPDAPAPPRPAMLGLTWAGVGWLPLVLPSIDWHPYYTLLGAMGAWLAIGTWLARRPAVASVALLAVAMLEPVQADTPVWSFSASLYQRRQAYFVGRLRAELLRMHPALPPRSRLYFSRVPNSIGLGYSWFSPAFSVWYADSTIHGGFWSSYRPRAADGAPDYFFRYDSSGVRWAEVRPGAEPVPGAMRMNSRWREDHAELAALFARTGDWPGAAGEYAKLWSATPESIAYAYDAGVAHEMAGDSTGAARAYRAVVESSRSTPDARTFARAFGARRAAIRNGPR